MTAHSFDCDCTECTAIDATAQGMSIFRKAPRANVTPVTATVATIEKREPIRRLPAGQKVGRGRVRTISDRQEWFILKLKNERDLTNLKLVTGQTLDPEEIPYMGLKGAKALIEKMLGCPYKGTESPVDNSTTTIPGSEKQVNWIKVLMTERNLTDSDLKVILKAHPTARTLIDFLLKMPKVAPQAITTPVVATQPVTEGMYIVGTRIFKVQAARGTGNLYAKELIDNSYEYVQGAISIVRREGRRMTIEEAKQYGKVTGTCCVCSRELTVQASIDAGIGPICASKF